MSIEVSQVWLETPQAPLLADVTVAQTEDLPGLVANAEAGGTIGIDISQVWLELPGTAGVENMAVSQVWLEVPGDIGARDITAEQTEDLPALVASMFYPVGSIDGGGTITDGLPHRSLTVSQTEDLPALSAAAGDVTLAPRLVTVANTEELPVLAFQADAQRVISAAQVEEFPTLDAMVRGPVVVAESTVTGGYGGTSRRYKTRVGSRVLEADTWQELRRLVLELEDEPEAKVERKIKISRIDTVADPVDAARAEMRAAMKAQLSDMQSQMAQMLALQQQGAQQLAQTYEQRLSSAEQAATTAMMLAQRAQQDSAALAALLTE